MIYCRDSWGRLMCEVVAIDALVFRSYKEQFGESMVQRELNKVHAGWQSAQQQSIKPYTTEIKTIILHNNSYSNEARSC